MRAAVVLFVFISTGIVLPNELPHAPRHVHRPARRELCPGAVYFFKRGEAKPEWLKQKRLVCRIGAHDFYR